MTVKWGEGEGRGEGYLLFPSSSLPWPSVMLSPRMMKARVSEGAQISTALTKYLPAVSSHNKDTSDSIRRGHSYQCTVLPPETSVALEASPFTIQDVVQLPGCPVISPPACPVSRYIDTARLERDSIV